MSEILIARFTSKREADAVAALIKKRNSSSRLVRGSSLEDLWLGEMINEGMKEKGSRPVSAFKKKLDRQIKLLKK